MIGNGKAIPAFILILSLTFLSGCASLREVSSFDEDDSSNNVTIMRNNNPLASGIHFWPTVDGKDIAGMHTNQHIVFFLEEGKHVLGVWCYGGPWPKWWHDELEVMIQPEQDHYFVLSPYVFGCADIEQVTSEQARKRLRESKRIKTGEISSCDDAMMSLSDSVKAICFP
jgi:hypothetical protein